MSSIVPDLAAIQNLAATHKGPVVMINLLKYREKAVGEEGSGADAYNRYGAAVMPMLAARGARIVWSGRPAAVLVGSEADHWDAVALVEYPSVQAFIEMATSAEYQKIHHHREAGLERTALIACAPIIFQPENR
jgi:uncharacterized protein (DUF1330 family)